MVDYITWCFQTLHAQRQWFGFFFCGFRSLDNLLGNFSHSRSAFCSTKSRWICTVWVTAAAAAPNWFHPFIFCAKRISFIHGWNLAKYTHFCRFSLPLSSSSPVWFSLVCAALLCVRRALTTTTDFYPEVKTANKRNEIWRLSHCRCRCDSQPPQIQTPNNNKTKFNSSQRHWFWYTQMEINVENGAQKKLEWIEIQHWSMHNRRNSAAFKFFSRFLDIFVFWFVDR